jgi:hypothetical protein
MFAFIKRLLSRPDGLSQSAFATHTDLSADEPLDRLFADLERESNRLVEEAIRGAVKTLRFAADEGNALPADRR